MRYPCVPGTRELAKRGDRFGAAVPRAMERTLTGGRIARHRLGSGP